MIRFIREAGAFYAQFGNGPALISRRLLELVPTFGRGVCEIQIHDFLGKYGVAFGLSTILLVYTTASITLRSSGIIKARFDVWQLATHMAVVGLLVGRL